MKSLYSDIRNILRQEGMAEGEARSIALLLLDEVCGMTTAEALTASCEHKDHDRLTTMAERISRGEPVQYVVGWSVFCGIRLRVGKGVLIPRPETEELVRWIADDWEASKQCGEKIIDIGTGSGCIAIALAKMCEESKVEAWDVSDEALSIARRNAEANGMEVEFKKVDVLSQCSCETDNKASVIVSNPPYICEEEAREMEANVLEHEPRLALFVPDDDPLLFYRKIACMGRTALREGGRLYFEINRRFGNEVVELLREIGYSEVELRQDEFGNDRMVKAIKRGFFR